MLIGGNADDVTMVTCGVDACANLEAWILGCDCLQRRLVEAGSTASAVLVAQSSFISVHLSKHGDRSKSTTCKLGRCTALARTSRDECAWTAIQPGARLPRCLV
jgi:hypothetical protein